MKCVHLKNNIKAKLVDMKVEPHLTLHFRRNSPVRHVPSSARGWERVQISSGEQDILTHLNRGSFPNVKLQHSAYAKVGTKPRLAGL